MISQCIRHCLIKWRGFIVLNVRHTLFTIVTPSTTTTLICIEVQIYRGCSICREIFSVWLSEHLIIRDIVWCPIITHRIHIVEGWTFILGTGSLMIAIEDWGFCCWGSLSFNIKHFCWDLTDRKICLRISIRCISCLLIVNFIRVYVINVKWARILLIIIDDLLI